MQAQWNVNYCDFSLNGTHLPKDWYLEISRALVDPARGLCRYTEEDKLVEFDPGSLLGKDANEKLEWYGFMGKVSVNYH